MSVQSQHTRGSDRLPSLDHATVGDVMHPGLVTCPPDTDLTTVARLMASDHIHCVVVTGVTATTGSEHLTWGLLTDLTLVRARRAAAFATAGEVALTEIVTVEPGEPLERAAELMSEHGLTHLVVVSEPDRMPVGMLSTLDVAGTLAWGEA